jgi:hypothetical protein
MQPDMTWRVILTYNDRTQEEYIFLSRWLAELFVWWLPGAMVAGDPEFVDVVSAKLKAGGHGVN